MSFAPYLVVPVVQPETYGDHVGQDVKFDDDDGSSPSVTGIAAGILWADFLFFAGGGGGGGSACYSCIFLLLLLSLSSL